MEFEEEDMEEFTIQTRHNSRRSVRLWMVLALLASILAGVTTALLIWHTVTSTQKICSAQDHHNNDTWRADETNDHIPVTLHIPCPEVPTVVSLPQPLPGEVQNVLDKLDSSLSDLVDENTSLPAISANIFHGDSVIWNGHYGSKIYNKARARPDENTVYRIGSITKIFPVLFIYKLYESGLIDSVDDPLKKYAPDFDIKNPFTNEDITLRQIASQMSGLPRDAPCVYHCTKTNSSEQLKLLKNRNLVVEPWTLPSYSNLGYALLGRLLTENLLNKTFESWVREEILTPLGMNNTGFEITSEVEKNMAFPYFRSGNKKPSRAAFVNFGWVAPAGEMYSTIKDLTKLGRIFTQPRTQKILKASTIREMSLSADISPDGRTIWGSPFEMLYSNGFVVRGKGGNIDTYESFFTFEPKLQLGMNVLISARGFVKTTGETAMGIATKANDLLLPAINNTLSTLQNSLSFPINGRPFTGFFLLNHTLPITLQTFEAIAQITEYNNLLRLQYVQPVSFSIRIRYIGLPWTFQASYYYKGISCWDKKSGILADMYFETPAQDGLSHNFVVPGWYIVGKRVSFNPKYQARVHETEKELINSFFQQSNFLRQF